MVAGRFVAVYVRVSTRGQSSALEEQERDVTRFASDRYPGQELRTFSDVASRDNPRRSGWLALLREVSAGRVVAIVCRDLTRLCSGMVQVGDLCARMGSHPTELVCMDGAFDFRGPGGRMVLAVLGELSAWELQRTRGRIRRGMAARKAKGLPMGRPAAPLPRTLDEYHRLVTVEGRTIQGLADEDAVSRPTLSRRLHAYRRELAARGDTTDG